LALQNLAPGSYNLRTFHFYLFPKPKTSAREDGREGKQKGKGYRASNLPGAGHAA
jgi:hypothetical protein